MSKLSKDFAYATTSAIDALIREFDLPKDRAFEVATKAIQETFDAINLLNKIEHEDN